MLIKDVKTITQEIIAQIMGKEYMEQKGYLEGIPADKLVDVGKDLLDTEMNAEKYTKALCVMLAKREIYEGNFTPLFKDILIDRIEWGGFIERDKIDYADILDDPVVNLENGKSYADIEHTFYQPKVSTKIYSEGKSIMIPISIQRVMLTEAFNNWDSMNAFISKIRKKVRDTLLKAIDRYAGVLVEAAAAISVKATGTAVYLLDDALEENVEGITASTTPAEAMANKAFILFVAKKIAEIRDNMKIDTTVYNNGTWPVGSTDTLLYLLTAYTRSLKFDVKSGLFNREDVGFGGYKSIPAWQAVRGTENGKGFTFETSSKISFASDSNNKLGIGTEAVEIPNVIGVLFDRNAIGLTVFKEYTTSSYTACADFWNEFIHSLTNQIVDSDFPIVAFLVDRNPTKSVALNTKATKVAKA